MTDNPAESSGFEGYAQFRLDPENDSLTQMEMGKLFGVSDRTIRDWNKKLDWSHIREHRKKLLDYQGSLVDTALFKKALAGDVRAIELWKQEKEGWVPTTAQKQTVRDERVDVDAKLNEYEAKIREELTRANGGADAGVPKTQGDPGVSGTA